MGIWCLYLLLHYLNGTATTLYFFYIVVHFLLLQTTIKLFSIPNFNFKHICYGIVLITTIESLYCLGQYLGVFKSQNNHFAVTGSCPNPNVIAQFLAMAVPVFFYLLQFKLKRIILVCLGVVAIALVLLKCRSAYIATLVTVVIYYGLEFNFINWKRHPRNKSRVIVLVTFILLIAIPVATHLYNSKKASADGRLFIWKLSAMMATEKPITGYGYGNFAKEYNLFQADYIAKGNATLSEQTTAGPTIMAYNEGLQNLVEGGIIGLIVFALFCGSLLLSVREKRKASIGSSSNQKQDELPAKKSVFNFAYAGMVGFITMAMFNFAIQAVPVMSMCTIYTAIICSQQEAARLSNTFSFLLSKWFMIAYKIIVCIGCLYVFYIVLHIAHSDGLNKKASILKKQGREKEALLLMPNLKYWLEEESNYWKNYGNILFLNEQYSQAIHCLTKAKATSSSPALYLGSGVCYEKLNLYPEAIAQYQQLVLLNPSKFNYRFRLMTAYLQNKDTLNTLRTAEGIINLKPKIPSEEVVNYKKKALIIGLTLDENFRNKMPVPHPFIPRRPQTQLNFQK